MRLYYLGFFFIISFWWNLLQLVSTLYLILFYYWWSKDLFLFYRKSHASKKHLILVISKIESEFKTTILTIYFLWIELGCSSKLILWIEQSTDKKSCCRKNVPRKCFFRITIAQTFHEILNYFNILILKIK